VGLYLWELALSAGQVTLQPVVTGLEDPVYLTFAPDEPHRLYVVEQAGRIVVIEKGKRVAAPFLDITSKVTSGGEMGLLSVAFHPAYAKNNRFFVYYNARMPKLFNVIAEYKSGQRDGKVILKIEKPFTNHNGGQLAFDKQGYLYIGTGDGGSAGDPYGNAQDKESLLGKMLRIDVDGAAPYAIPRDNPFAVSGGRKEIFAYGLRNPWRFSFDRETGALFAGDVGQNRREEIDIVERGKNYGWNIMEGMLCFKPEKNCNQKGLALPILDYPQSQGYSVIGGYVYRGKLIQELKGVYVYGDYGSGFIWGLKYDSTGRTATSDVLIDSHLPISSFGEDTDGELYVVSHRGMIFKIVRKIK